MRSFTKPADQSFFNRLLKLLHTSKSLALSGALIFISWASYAQTQASNIVVEPVSTTSLRIKWTNGASTTGRLVVVSSNNTGAIGSFVPQNGVDQVTYTVSTAFPTDNLNATDLDTDTGGQIAILAYNGTGSTAQVTVTGLGVNNFYRITVYEYTGVSTNPTYVSSSGTNNPRIIWYATAATGTYTTPTGITSVTVQAWGGGGTGGGVTGDNAAGGGGAGGAYAESILTVTPSTGYFFAVAQTVNGTNGNGPAGEDTWFNSSNAAPTTIAGVLAKGGARGTRANSPTESGAGASGTVTGSFGTTDGISNNGVSAGGNGAAGLYTSPYGGGGGESGGPSGTGTSAATSTGGAAKEGAGDGANGPTSAAGGNNGFFPGGAGSGAYTADVTDRSGGDGAGPERQARCQR